MAEISIFSHVQPAHHFFIFNHNLFFKKNFKIYNNIFFVILHNLWNNFYFFYSKKSKNDFFYFFYKKKSKKQHTTRIRISLLRSKNLRPANLRTIKPSNISICVWSFTHVKIPEKWIRPKKGKMVVIEIRRVRSQESLF